MTHVSDEIENEAKRLFASLEKSGWSLEDCELIAPMTLEINSLKKEQDAIILAHSYQTPDIMYGVADYLGDSYALSVLASKKPAKKIIFCSVHFMGETAKLLSPDKEVIVPAVAGCSLADSITAQDVRQLRKQHPEAGVICYVNTSAEVKAECDACCTSSNVVKVVEAMPQKDIIFLPDNLMGKNLQNMTSKNIILWEGTCIVHDKFDVESVKAVRQQFPDAKILAHTECSPSVIKEVDLAGGTKDMLGYIDASDASDFMLITECGLTDRVKVEHQDKNIVGSCVLCPYMKKITLKGILEALNQPSKKSIISIPDDTATKARNALERMFELEALYDRSRAEQ